MEQEFLVGVAPDITRLANVTWYHATLGLSPLSLGDPVKTGHWWIFSCPVINLKKRGGDVNIRKDEISVI